MSVPPPESAGPRLDERPPPVQAATDDPRPLSRAEEDAWASFCHLSIPFLGFVGPLVVHVLQRDRSAWLRDQALETLNFSILYTAAQLVSAVLVGVLIGLVLLPMVFIAALVLAILGGLAASRHEPYRYPLSWRFVT